MLVIVIVKTFAVASKRNEIFYTANEAINSFRLLKNIFYNLFVFYSNQIMSVNYTIDTALNGASGI